MFEFNLCEMIVEVEVNLIMIPWFSYLGYTYGRNNQGLSVPDLLNSLEVHNTIACILEVLDMINQSLETLHNYQQVSIQIEEPCFWHMKFDWGIWLVLILMTGLLRW